MNRFWVLIIKWMRTLSRNHGLDPRIRAEKIKKVLIIEWGTRIKFILTNKNREDAENIWEDLISTLWSHCLFISTKRIWLKEIDNFLKYFGKMET